LFFFFFFFFFFPKFSQIIFFSFFSLFYFIFFFFFFCFALIFFYLIILHRIFLLAFDIKSDLDMRGLVEDLQHRARLRPEEDLLGLFAGNMDLVDRSTRDRPSSEVNIRILEARMRLRDAMSSSSVEDSSAGPCDPAPAPPKSPSPDAAAPEPLKPDEDLLAAARLGTSAPAAPAGFLVPRSPSLPAMHKFSSPAGGAALDPGRTNRARYLGTLGINPRSPERAPRDPLSCGPSSATVPVVLPSQGEMVGVLEHPLSPRSEGPSAPSGEDITTDMRQLSTDTAVEADGAQKSQLGSQQSSFALPQSAAAPSRRSRTRSQSRTGSFSEVASSGIANLLRTSGVAADISPRAADNAADPTQYVRVLRDDEEVPEDVSRNFRFVNENRPICPMMKQCVETDAQHFVLFSHTPLRASAQPSEVPRSASMSVQRDLKPRRASRRTVPQRSDKAAVVDASLASSSSAPRQSSTDRGSAADAAVVSGSGSSSSVMERSSLESLATHPLMSSLVGYPDILQRLNEREDVLLLIPIYDVDGATYNRDAVESHVVLFDDASRTQYRTYGGNYGVAKWAKRKFVLERHMHGDSTPCLQEIRIVDDREIPIMIDTRGREHSTVYCVAVADRVRPDGCDLYAVDPAALSSSSHRGGRKSGALSSESARSKRPTSAIVARVAGRGSSSAMNSSAVPRVSKPLPNPGLVISREVQADTPFAEKLAHPLARQLKTSVDSFIMWFLKHHAQEGASDVVQTFLGRMEQSMNIHPLWEHQNSFQLVQAKDDLRYYVFDKLFDTVFRTPDTVGKDRLIQGKLRKLRSFLQPEHLEIPADLQDKTLWQRAQQELSVINNFRSPKQKLMCVMNCCRILIYALQNAGSPAGADDFTPQLIYTVIMAAPENLYSNVTYISKYCEPDMMVLESVCFYTHLVFAVSFIEQLSASSLSIDAAVYAEHMK
jgi:hypothetical protein